MKRKLNVIESIDDNHLVARDYLNNSLLLMKKHMENYEYIKNNNLNEMYHANVMIKEIKFEALEIFPPYDVNLGLSILKSVKQLNKPINVSINKIMAMLSDFKDNVSYQKVRGVFGELYALTNFDIKYKDSDLSIYDYLDSGDNDVEIKTFSKVDRTINVSYQQLDNNENAIVYAIETFESSNGQSVRELLEKLPYDISKKFDWISTSKSRNLDEKFECGEVIIKRISEYKSGLKMPDNAIDAKFKFRV